MSSTSTPPTKANESEHVSSGAGTATRTATIKLSEIAVDVDGACRRKRKKKFPDLGIMRMFHKLKDIGRKKEDLDEIALQKKYREKAAHLQEIKGKKRERQLEKNLNRWRLTIQPMVRAGTIEKKTLRVRQFCFAGIPPSVRGEAWPALIGNQVKVTRGLFDMFSKQAAEIETRLRHVERMAEEDREEEEAAVATELSKEKITTSSSHPTEREETLFHSLKCILLDLPRTYPDLAFFHGDFDEANALKQILTAYACYRPDVGYVQGMSYLAAMLLLNVDKYCAFQCFANILHNHFYLDVHHFSRSKVKLRLHVFDVLLKKRLPRLERHFECIGVQSNMYVLTWFLTIFSSSFPLDIASHVWDCYFAMGEIFLFRAAIGLLSLLERQMLQMALDGVLMALHRLPKTLDHAQLFSHIGRVKISQKLFAAALRDAEIAMKLEDERKTRGTARA